MNQPVPQYWDMEEGMPDVSEHSSLWYAAHDWRIEGGLGEIHAFLAGAQAMWDKLKAEGSIKR